MSAKAKRIFNSRLPFRTEQLHWSAGEVVSYSIEYDGRIIEGYTFPWEEDRLSCVITPFAKELSELPVNFFSTELLEVDTTDDKSLTSFIEKWGFPFSAYRFWPDVGPIKIPGREKYDLFENVGIRATDLLWRLTEWSAETSQHTDFFIGVSKSEAISTLTAMQDGVRSLFKMLDDSASRQAANNEIPPYPYDSDLSYFNYGASNKYSIAMLDEEGFFEYEHAINASDKGLTSAICNQVIEAIHNEREWVQCKAEGCGRWFKSKRGTSAPRSNSEYCSVRCANKQVKRNQRAI
jgi:hypothetical protein